MKESKCRGVKYDISLHCRTHLPLERWWKTFYCQLIPKLKKRAKEQRPTMYQQLSSSTKFDSIVVKHRASKKVCKTKLSSIEARSDRIGKQEQKHISRNHVQTIFGSSVPLYNVYRAISDSYMRSSEIGKKNRYTKIKIPIRLPSCGLRWCLVASSN